MTFSIHRQLIKTPQGKIKYWRPKEVGREHYHVGIWVEASEDELDTLEFVEYKLHASFKKPNRISRARGNKFSITVWTWGMFSIEVILHFKNGEIKQIPYYLSYDLPADNGENYTEVEA
tara:strand:- start:584 stop:940 length:357 start_codon:yes stop_codon:yes gene_type:complete